MTSMQPDGAVLGCRRPDVAECRVGTLPATALRCVKCGRQGVKTGDGEIQKSFRLRLFFSGGGREQRQRQRQVQRE